MLKKTSRVILFLLILFVLSIGAILSSLNWYLEVNKAKIIQQLEALHNGTASYSEVKVQVWQHFPKVSITVDSVALYDSLFIEHQKPLLQLSQIRADFSVRKLLQDSIEIERIHLKDGQVNIFTDQGAYNNLNSIFPLNQQKKGTKKEDKAERLQLITPKLKFNLSNINFSFTNALKYKHIEAHINQLRLNLDQSPSQLAADLKLDLKVQELAFNTQKGSFLKNSSVKGQIKVQMEDSLVNIPMNTLHINAQDFLVGATIFTDQKTVSKLFFKNTATHFDETVQLLTPAIQEKLTPFHVAGSFSTETVVESTFGPGEDPKVTINFELTGNETQVKDYLFEDLIAEGSFSNRLYEDKRSLMEGKKNVRLELHQLSTQYGPFKLQTPNLLFIAKAKHTNLISKVQIRGTAPAISDWLKTKQFQFDKGDFELVANVNGSLNDVNQLITSSSANLTLENIDVLYKPGDVIFPLDQLVLEKDTNETHFKMVSSEFDPIHDLSLEGALKNLPAVLNIVVNQSASSEVSVDAAKISWSSFLDYFGNSPSEKKTDSEKKQSLKKMLTGLHENFHPQFSLAVDTLTYYDKLLLTNFFSGLYFKDESTLALEETTFQYDEGVITLSGSIDISDPFNTPFKLSFSTEHLNLQELLPSLDYFGIKMLSNMDSLPTDMNLSIRHEGIINDSIGLLKDFNKGEITFNDGSSGNIKGLIQYAPTAQGLDTKITIEGKPELINEFYDAEEFFFTDGSLKVGFSYQGDVEYVNQLVQEAKVTLSIKDSEIYYKPVDVYFPIKELSAEASQGNAHFDLVFQSDSLKRKLVLKGEFDHLDAFLLKDVDKAFQVNAEAFSPKFYWEDFEELLGQGPQGQKEAAADQGAVRESIKAMLHTFDPEFKLRFDTFVYSDKLVLENLRTGLDLVDSNILKLEETGFTFHDGTVQLNAEFDLGGTNQAPFEMVLETKDLDVGSLMQKLDYLGIKSLQEVKKLTGELSMQLDLKSIFDGDLQTLVPNATDALITFDLQNVRIEGFQAIDDFAKKFKMKDRFADIRFAPLTNNIKISGNTMDIPLMEIQSNAIQVFIEGFYHLSGDSSNIWVSLPLRNLKKPDLNNIPEKTGYAFAGGKIFLEASTDSTNESSIKLRLRKKKFYKSRGILPQFKADKKRYKQERKDARNARKK